MNDLTSIIIPCHNKLDYTKLCIQSILDHTQYVKTPFQIVVVNNASTDGTKEYLDELEKKGTIQQINLTDNKGFPNACNEGAKVATGNLLCICNNDIVLTEGWLEKMLRVLRSDPKLVAVGPYCNASSGYQGVNAPPYKDDKSLQELARQFHAPENYVDMLVFFCVLIKKTIWDELQGLDEDFNPGNFEDNYFAYQVIQKGYKLKTVAHFVYHFGSTSWKDYDKNRAYEKLLARNQRIFLNKIGQYKRVSLCMIVGDYESLENLKRCLDSIAMWVDEICVLFNYKYFPQLYSIHTRNTEWRRPKKFSILSKLEWYIEQCINCNGEFFKAKYLKWTNFSDMRNKSLEMAEGDYILWLDTDDVIQTPIGTRDVIFRNPDVDIFRCEVYSRAEVGGWEKIYQPRLIRNIKELKFRNPVHEDLMLKVKEMNLKTTTTNLTIKHLGYTTPEVVIQKNRRNIKYLLQEIREGKAHSLTYYHLINSYMVIAYNLRQKDLFKKALTLIDEAFTKFNLTKDDPITPKMWVLRGHCCERFNALAAKQAYHKAWDEWRHPEGGVNLAEMYKREANYDKAIEILETLYSMKEIRVGSNLAININELKHILFKKLGDCYLYKFNMEKDPQKKAEYCKKAEQHYKECLLVVDDLEVIDRLCQILRNTKRMKEANILTAEAVNRFPTYGPGFSNLGCAELMAERYETAKLFFRHALKINPKHKEARINLSSIEKMQKGNKEKRGDK